jgi:hypothetical protein
VNRFEDTRLAGAKRTAWIVGAIAFVVYAISILDVVLKR